MRFLQPSLSSAASRASSHDSSSILRSSRIVSGQFFLGFPLPLFRPGVQGRKRGRGRLVWLFYSCSFWPHDPTTSVFFLIMQPRSSCLVLSLIILFGILSLHVTCN